MPRRLLICSVLALCAEAQFGGGQTCGFPCARGKYCISQWRRGCRECAAGKYSRDRDLAFCTVCVPGKYQPHTGASACRACPVSKFQPAHRARHCYPCRAGRTSNKGATSCDAVLPAPASVPASVLVRAPPSGHGLTPGPGLAAPANATAPRPRPTTATAAATATAVKLRSGCQRGQALVERGIGGHGCQACPSGRYGAADLRCVPCPPGRFQPYGSKPSCFPCGEGHYSDERGASLCLPTHCSAGQHQVAVTSAGCATCARGWYQPEANKLSCKRCACGTGRYRRVSTPLRCECAQCPVGQHQVAPGVARCALCPSGRFQAAKGKLKCAACPPGRFTSLRGNTCDGACPAGAYRPKARDNAPAYVSSSAWGTEDDGTADPDHGSGHAGGYGAAAEDARRGCFACPVGKHSVVTNAKECKPCACERGKYQEQSGKAALDSHVIYGSHNRAGSSQRPGLFAQCTCAQCPAGKHQRHFNRARCAPCGAGAFQPEPGQARCEACPAGKFRMNTSRPRASKSDDGRGYSRGTACSRCGAGQYQPQMGQARCEWCVPPKKKKANGKNHAVKKVEWRESPSAGRHTAEPPVMVISSGGAQCYEACPAGRYRYTPHKGPTRQAGPKPASQLTNVPHCAHTQKALQCACKKWATPSACGKFATADVCFAPCCGCPDMAKATAMQRAKRNTKRRRLATPKSGAPTQHCLACPPGKFRLQPRSEHRWAGVALALSETQLSGTSSCASCSCPRGRFQYSVERCHCTACPDGKFNRFKGSYYCFPCPKGKWSRTMPTDLNDPLHSRYRFYSVTKCKRVSKLSPHHKRVTHDKAHNTTVPGVMPLGKSLLLLVQPGHAGQAFRNKLGQRCSAGRHLAVRGHDVSRPSSIQMACLMCAKGRYRQVREARTDCKSCACPKGRWQRDATACTCDKQQHEEVAVKQKERLRIEEKARMKQYEKAEKKEAKSEAETKERERGKRRIANRHMALPPLRIASDDDDNTALKAATAASLAKMAGSASVAAANHNPAKTRVMLPTWLGPLVTPIVIGLVVMPVLGIVVCANAATNKERGRKHARTEDGDSLELASETVGIAALGGRPYSSDTSMLVMGLDDSSSMQHARSSVSGTETVTGTKEAAEPRRKKRTSASNKLASKSSARSQGHGSSMQVAPDGSLLLNGRRAFGTR